MPFFGETTDTKDYSEFIAEFDRNKPDADLIDHPNIYPLLHTAVCKNSKQGCLAVIDYFREHYDISNRNRKFRFHEAINYKEESNNYTALHIACQVGNLNLIRLLMENGKAIDSVVDKNLNIPLHYAVVHLHVDVVNYLLTKRLLTELLNLISFGPTEPIGNDIVITEAAVNTENGNGDTPLLLALKLNITDEKSAANRDEIVEALLNKYNELQIKEDYQLPQLRDDSYLMLAIKNNLKSSIINTVVKRKFSDSDKINADGMSALHLAVLSGNSEYVQILLENNASTALKNKEGFTALHLAVMQDKVNPEIIELLLDYSAANGHLDIGDADNQNNVLHMAAKLCDPTITALIIDYGANVNLENNLHQTPSMIALKSFMTMPLNDFSENSGELSEDERKILKMADNQFRNYLYLCDYVDKNSDISKSLADELNQFFTPKNNTSHQQTEKAIQENIAQSSLTTHDKNIKTNMQLRIESISATSSPASSSRPLVQSAKQQIIHDNHKIKIGILTRLNNYRISLWRQFKATKMGRFIRRHPYISLAILTLGVTGFVALCVFAPPVAAHIPILLGISKALTAMKILSATANILKPIAETVSMTLPAAVLTLGIACQLLTTFCYKKVKNYFWPSKSKYVIEVSQADISSFNEMKDAEKSAQLDKKNITAKDFNKQQKSSATFSFADDLISLFNCCGARKKADIRGEYQAVSVKGKERDEKVPTAVAELKYNSYSQPVM